MNEITAPYGTKEYYRQIGRKGGRATAKNNDMVALGSRGGQARAAMPGFEKHQRSAGKARAEAGDMAEIGRKGAAATARKYGPDFLIRCMQRYRRENPSSHERQVAAILDYLNYPYLREARLLEDQYFLVDFYLPGFNDAVIEVNGKIHFDPIFRRDPEQDRRIEDARRRRKLERAGFRVLEIDYRELTSEFDVRLKIVNFLLA